MSDQPILSSLKAFNSKQQEAITSDNSRVLVLAGAGSGKTKTLLQKIVYLIECKEVKPSEILAITFTKAAANEMIDRLITSADLSGQYQRVLHDKRVPTYEKNKLRIDYSDRIKWVDGLLIKTFHSFCYNLLRTYGANEFDNKFRIIADSKTDEEEFMNFVAPELIGEVFKKILIEKCHDNNYLLDFKRYILDYYVDKIHLNDHTKNLKTYEKPFTTLDGTKVSSKSEQFIADWLYRHSIKYAYEPKIKIKDFDFRPDFFIPAANLYIEHVSDKSYSTVEKVEQFNKGGIHFVKTYDSMTKDSSLFNYKLDQIFSGVLPVNYQKTVVLNFAEEFKGYMKDINDFLVQVIRVIDMIKAEALSIDEIQKNAAEDQHERIRGFYGLAIPLIKDYKQYCINKSYLDFNDLISTSISLLTNHGDIHNAIKTRFKYILVDEFQDVNNLQVELLKLILNSESHLFCVGDDWQSIYGFRGSNVSYIIEFQKHFPVSDVIKLDLNYRSTPNIVNASNEVIKNNKFKVEKEIFALKKSTSKICIHAGSSEEENVQYAVKEVSRLIEEGSGVDDILFLYRRTKMFKPYQDEFNNQGIKVKGRTIHGAKGLEAGIVFIIGLTDGQGGFPDIWLMDRIFQTIKKSDYDLLLEEERRLFYVALTRAKDKIYLITEKGCESRFLNEIPKELTEKTAEHLLPVVDEVFLCKKCNSPLEVNFSFCPFCGQEIKVTNS